jgi:hypothetical protein
LVKKIFKLSVVVGCNFGAVLGILVALMINFLGDGSFGGGWYEAVEYDLRRWFGPDLAAISWVVYSGIVLVIVMISAIGALLGAFFGAVVGKLLSALD